MAAKKTNTIMRFSSKLCLKYGLLLAVVIFILSKLLGEALFDQPVVKSEEHSSNGKLVVVQNEILDFSKKKDANAVDKADDIPSSFFEGDKRYSVWNFTKSWPKDAIPVMIPLVNAKHNRKLEMQFRTCVISMSEMSSAQIMLIVTGDQESRAVAETVVNELRKKNIQLHHVDIDALGREMNDSLGALKQHISGSHPHYTHTLFFLSIALHRLAPPTLSRLIMLDADLRFHADVKLLHAFFDRFSPTNIIGVAHENQPVYRHILWKYRKSNPGTRAGDPPPAGLPGFNSGVLLLDLEKMQRSSRYNALLDPESLHGLVEKYSFKGHLGDQDFYSLVSLEREELFFVLPCTWNRQLCTWWRDKGYEDIFDSYFACEGRVNIYHGNCNAPFPEV